MKHRKDKPNGIVNKSDGIIISIIISSSVQLLIVIISKSSVIFNTYIYFDKMKYFLSLIVSKIISLICVKVSNLLEQKIFSN